MAPYSDADSDAERLPEGMTRIGYDADTETYTYADRSGAVYEGLPGNRYGHMRATGRRVDPTGYDAGDGSHLERYKKKWEADWRYFAPFMLIIGVYLLLVLKWSFRDGKPAVTCGHGFVRYDVVEGDTCYDIAERFGTTVDGLKAGMGSDKALDCDHLQIGTGICVPKME